jgi:HAE1 family hydrophobic/amphiphilic exporter-1
MVVGITTVTFLAGVACFGVIGSEFMTAEDQNQLQVGFKTAPDASFEETRGRIDAVLAILKELPEVELTYASIGAGDTGTVRDASVFVKLVDKTKRRRSAAELAAEVRRRLAGVPGIIPSVGLQADAFGGKPITLAIRGEDVPTLRRYGAQLKAEAQKIPGLVDIEVTMDMDLPEYQLLLDRQRAANLGLGMPALSRTVSALVGGQAVTTWEDEDGEAVDVRVRLPPALREDVSQVGNLHVAVLGEPGGRAALVPLSDLFHVERAVTAPQISRTDLSREVQLSANLDGVALDAAVEQLQAAAARIQMQPGYKIVSAGDEERMDESFGYMLDALLLSVVLVYLILSAQFESFIEPLSIMVSLPLAVVGMAGMMLIARDTISIMSFIGLIMLMGLVTKNAILLVEYTKVLRREGLERRLALITAGRARLRPILMTTLAMIFGMVPLALGIGQGAEGRAPMSHAVVGGLITSTALTLIVVPVVYSLLDDLQAWVVRRFKAKKGQGRSAAVRVAAAVAIAFLALPARAADASVSGKRILSLDESIQIALDKNRDVARARVYQEWVRGKYVEERAAALPSLAATANVTKARDEAASNFADGQQPAGSLTEDVGVTVDQALFTWGKTRSAMRAARLAIDAAEDDLERYRQAVARDVTEAFYDALYAHEIVDIAKDTLAQRRRQLDETLQRQALGTATDYDVLAARVATDNQRPEVLRAEGQVVLALDRLRLLLAQESADFDVAGTFEVGSGAVPSLEEASRTALEHRPDLKSLAGAVDIREELVSVAAAGNKPRLDLQAGAGWRWLELGPGPGSASGDGKTWNVGLTLTFPFFDGMATRGRVAQAESDLATSKLDWAKARDAAQVEVHTALDQVRVSAEIVRALSGAVEQAQRLLVMAQTGNGLGVKTRLEVEDALLNVRLAEANMAKARRDHVVALANLKFAQGTLGH